MKTQQPRTACGLLFLLSLAGLLLAACSQPDPRTAPISAPTPEAFDAWKVSAAQKIPRAEMDEFDSCVNEIRMGIMQRREASGSRPVAEKLCEYVNGKTMREVEIMGYQATVDWVTKEIALKRDNIKQNEEMLKYPINEASREKIVQHSRSVEDNIKNTLMVKLDAAQKRLAELRAGDNTKAP